MVLFEFKFELLTLSSLVAGAPVMSAAPIRPRPLDVVEARALALGTFFSNYLARRSLTGIWV